MMTCSSGSLQLPVPIAVPPQKKQMKDASVQSEPVALEDEKPKDGPGDTAGESLFLSWFLSTRID